MSNFTRSILYSTSVLVAGLVAIFAIYSSVTTAPDGSGYAQISPAAGGSDLGIIYEENGLSGTTDPVSSDTYDMIEPIDKDMQEAIDQIDSTINEFEFKRTISDEDKESHLNSVTTIELAGDLNNAEAEIRNKLEKNVMGLHVDSLVDQATQKAIDEVGPSLTSGYVGERVISYRCRIGRDNDTYDCDEEGRNCTITRGRDAYTTRRDIYDGNEYSGSRGYTGYDGYYWGTCHRRSTFEEDMEYNKRIIKNTTDSSINSAINDSMRNTGIDPVTGAPKTKVNDSIDNSVREAIDKADPSVRSEVEQKINEERRKRGY